MAGTQLINRRPKCPSIYRWKLQNGLHVKRKIHLSDWGDFTNTNMALASTNMALASSSKAVTSTSKALAKNIEALEERK